MCGFSIWTLLLTVGILLVFATIGIGCIINPDWGIKHFGQALRRGGELLTKWNRIGLQFVGLAFGGFAVYLLYVLLRGCY